MSADVTNQLVRRFEELTRGIDRDFPLVVPGKRRPFFTYHPGTNYRSQYGQDYIVERMLNGLAGGYFFEMGGVDGVHLSNTYLFEKDHGWRGLLVEPNAEFGRLIPENRSCSYDDSCVSDEIKDVDFTIHTQSINRSALSGMCGPQFDNKRPDEGENDGSLRIVKKRTRLLRDVLDEHAVPDVIDYFSLDVEGAEWQVMQTFPFERIRIRYMNIERPNPALKACLEEEGYMELGHHQADVHYAHPELVALPTRPKGIWGRLFGPSPT